jgi:hypothetical protein
MIRSLFAVILTLASLLAQAQNGAPPEPPVQSNPIATAIFGLLFIGFCVGFAVMVWRNQRKGRQDESAKRD